MADGRRATLSGEGIHMIPVRQATRFLVDANDAGDVGDAFLEVNITSKFAPPDTLIQYRTIL